MQQITTKIQPLINPFFSEIEENDAENDAVKVRKWNQEEYYKMAELGFFHGKRVELIEGEIIEMSPMKSPHATSVSLVGEILREIFQKDYFVRSQLPMSFSKNTEPEPDIAVIKGKIRDFAEKHPKTAELIIEVSDATLSYDRTAKAGIYAKNEIQDYWIVNVKNSCLEVYRHPINNKNLGFVYSERTIFTEKDTVSPLAAPKAKIKVADLLP